MKRKLIFGVPLVPLIVTVFLASVCFILFEDIVVIPISFIVLVLMAFISKKDEYLLENFFQSLFEPSFL